MADFAASVLARLKNKARETGRSYQLCLQLFCQEEFLRKLQGSKYSKNLILKGGMLIYTLTDFESRVTVDVDFLLKSIPNTPEGLRPILDEILAVEIGNGYIAFEVTRIEPISVTKKYTGVAATVITRIKNTRTAFTLDFGVGDVIVPGAKKHRIPTQLPGFESPFISAFSVESTIAEKLDAILSLMEYSSRMKDYFDILYLSRKFNFDGAVLKEAIKKTFANRDRDFGIKQFDLLMDLDSDSGMQKKWMAFLRKIKTSEVDFRELLSAINIFLRDIIIAIESDKVFEKIWSSTDGCWE